MMIYCILRYKNLPHDVSFTGFGGKVTHLVDCRDGPLKTLKNPPSTVFALKGGHPLVWYAYFNKYWLHRFTTELWIYNKKVVICILLLWIIVHYFWDSWTFPKTEVLCSKGSWVWFPAPSKIWVKKGPTFKNWPLVKN